MIAAAILGFEEQKRLIDLEIAELRAMDSGGESGAAVQKSESGELPRRKMSAATRKAMALAQQKRWAAKKKAASEPEVTAPPKPKRKLSAAGKKRIIEASKRYWAERRAAAKTSS